MGFVKLPLAYGRTRHGLKGIENMRRPSTASKRLPGLVATAATFPPLTATSPSLLLDGSDKTFRELVGAFLEIGSQVRELRLFLAAQLGVTEPQYRVVLAIAHLQKAEGINVGAVAEHLSVSPNFVTMEVRKLEMSGLVKKSRNPGDGRGVLLSLSRKGRDAYHAVIGTIQEINNVMYGHLTEKEFLLLLRALKKVIKGGQLALDVAHGRASGAKGSPTAHR